MACLEFLLGLPIQSESFDESWVLMSMLTILQYLITTATSLVVAATVTNVTAGPPSCGYEWSRSFPIPRANFGFAMSNETIALSRTSGGNSVRIYVGDGSFEDIDGIGRGVQATAGGLVVAIPFRENGNFSLRVYEKHITDEPNSTNSSWIRKGAHPIPLFNYHQFAMDQKGDTVVALINNTTLQIFTLNKADWTPLGPPKTIDEGFTPIKITMSQQQFFVRVAVAGYQARRTSRCYLQLHRYDTTSQPAAEWVEEMSRYFGEQITSVVMNGNGTLVAVGMPYKNKWSGRHGQVSLLALSNTTTWKLHSEIKSPWEVCHPNCLSGFAREISMSSDGTRIAIGASGFGFATGGTALGNSVDVEGRVGVFQWQPRELHSTDQTHSSVQVISSAHQTHSWVQIFNVDGDFEEPIGSEFGMSEDGSTLSVRTRNYDYREVIHVFKTSCNNTDVRRIALHTLNRPTGQTMSPELEHVGEIWVEPDKWAGTDNPANKNRQPSVSGLALIDLPYRNTEYGARLTDPRNVTAEPVTLFSMENETALLVRLTSNGRVAATLTEPIKVEYGRGKRYIRVFDKSSVRWHWSQRGDTIQITGLHYFGIDESMAINGDGTIMALRVTCKGSSYASCIQLYSYDAGAWKTVGGQNFGYVSDFVLSSTYDTRIAFRNDYATFVKSFVNNTWLDEARIEHSKDMRQRILGNYNSLAMNHDGTVLAIGSFRAGFRKTVQSGIAEIYERSKSGLWSKKATIKGSSGSVFHIDGSSVAMDASGNKLVVGVPGANSKHLTQPGRLFFFERQPGTLAWDEIGHSDGSSNVHRLGAWVDINEEGTIVAASTNAHKQSMGSNYIRIFDLTSTERTAKNNSGTSSETTNGTFKTISSLSSKPNPSAFVLCTQLAILLVWTIWSYG